jgi:hypothetical protein
VRIAVEADRSRAALEALPDLDLLHVADLDHLTDAHPARRSDERLPSARCFLERTQHEDLGRSSAGAHGAQPREHDARVVHHQQVAGTQPVPEQPERGVREGRGFRPGLRAVEHQEA